MAYSTTERAAASEQLIVHRILPGLRGAKPNRAKGGWDFFCPLEHRKQNAPATIWVNEEGWISVHCFDCQRDAELRQTLVVPHLRDRPPPPVAPRPPAPPRRPQPRTDLPAKIWADTDPIPFDNRHPARRWFANRHLWRPEVEAPAQLRWLPADRTRPGPHTGAGSLVALLAKPTDWASAWPNLPNPQAVEIIAVDANGNPAFDRPQANGGLGKRTLGDKTGTLLFLGNPMLASANAPVRVAEGVADALALTARFTGPAVASMGDAGMNAAGFAQWLANAVEGVIIHADNDPAGQKAASRLCGTIRIHGGNARAVLPPEGKDAGVASSMHPFNALTQNWPGYADTLAEINGWPRWEAQRQAALTMESLSA